MAAAGLLLLLAAGAVTLASACRRDPAPIPPPADTLPAVESPRRPAFELIDRAAEAGVQFVQRNGEEANRYTILEQLGSGVALVDYDADGWPDIYLPGGGSIDADDRIGPQPAALFRNLGQLRFQAVAAEARLPDPAFYAHGCACGDYNQDGFADLLVTGYRGIELYRNLGDGTFAAVGAAVGLNDVKWATSAAWGDVTGDGNLDVYACQYVDWDFSRQRLCNYSGASRQDICPPKEFAPLPDLLWASDGGGSFGDISHQAGLRTDGRGLGVVLFDSEDDGDLDVYVANDTDPNFLYRNDGGGTLREQGHAAGVALGENGSPDGSMGVDVLDYNLDGRQDLWVANFEHEAFALYRSEGGGYFLCVSSATGITALGGLYVGFGTAASDLDRDGDEDILVANGHVLRHPVAAPVSQLTLLLENESPRPFFEPAEFPQGYFAVPHRGRGLATADLDRDGDQDVLVTHVNEPVAMLINQTQTDAAWLAVRLIGRHSNRDGVGARIVLHTTSGERVRQVKGGGSYLSHGDRNPFWGLPAGTSVSGLSIHWPSGIEQQVGPVTLNRLVTVIEREASEP
jgi:hypothetical protein